MKHFFSYSRRDSEFVKRLANDLKERKVNVWLDQLDIPVGAKWDTCIEQALNEAIGIILVLSASSVQSDNVMDEVNYAITKGKHIIPIKLDNCEVPFRLARIQQIDFQGDYEKSVETVATNIHLHINARQANTDTKIATAIDTKTISDPPRITNVEDTNDTNIAKPKPDSARMPGNEVTSDTKIARANSEPPRIARNEDTSDTKTAGINPNAPRLTWKDDANGAKTAGGITPGPPRTTRNEEATKTIKPKVDAPGIAKSNKKIIYAVFLAAGILLLFFWLFATPSGKDFYSSLFTSFPDNNYHHKKQFMPELLLIVIVGAIAGWLAGMIVGSDGQSFLLDVIIGIVGGYISSKWIFHGTWRLTGYYYANLILTATVGAAILAFVIKLIRRAVKH